MTTPEQPATPPLTRKQLREIRNTGSTPVITVDGPSEDAPSSPDLSTPDSAVSETQTASEHSDHASAQHDTSEAEQPAEAPVVAAAPLARPAQPVAVGPIPMADSSVDLGASPLTRRQARQQERIRTASVPVITPEVAAAHAAAMPGDAPLTQTEPLSKAEPVGGSRGMHDLFGLAPSRAAVATADAEHEVAATSADPDQSQSHADADDPVDAATEDEQKERVVNPLFGAGLLAGEPERAELPPSFDQLLARSTGAVSVPNALILSQAPEVAPIAPLSATGEVLITGTLNLPEGLGSTGHVRGTADGKEVDATLVDGELPAHSSPTPIAASAAISTVKTAGEVIRPPAPEKGSRLMLTLAITAGALALALVGVLILAFVTGAL